MEVILLQKVENLGGLGTKVNVKSGYGRNFLLPTGRAVAATKENIAAFDARRAELERHESDAMAAAVSRKGKLEAMSITIARKAGDEGRLFGSVGAADIAKACTEAGVEVSKKQVRLPNGPLHTIGEFAITLHLHSDIDATLRLHVVTEN